jgi:hypothetical protein
MNRYVTRGILWVTIITVLSAALGMVLGHYLDLNWQPVFAITLTVLVAVEAIGTSLYLVATKRRRDDRVRFRIAEGCFLVLAAHMIDIVVSGNLGGMPTIFFSPNLHGLLVLALTLLVWQQTLSLMGDFFKIDEDLLPGLLLTDGYQPPIEYLTNRVFIFGVLLFGMDAVIANFVHAGGTALFLTLIYFGAGITLLAVAARDSAIQKWKLAGLVIKTDTIAPWMWFAVALILIAVLVGLLIPTDLLTSAGEALIGLLAALADLFRFSWQPSQSNYLPPTPIPLQLGGPKPFIPPTTYTSPRPAINFFGPLLQWTVLSLIIVYVVYTYIADHPVIMAALKKLRVGALLRELWRTLLADLRAARRSVVRYLPRIQVRRPQVKTPDLTFVRLNRRSSREQVYYYYLASLYRAEQTGIPRRPPQTPHEFRNILNPKLGTPDDQAAFDALTQFFLEARYSRNPVEAEQVIQARERYEQVRRTLQHIRRSKP